MPFQSQRAALELSDETRARLESISRSRSEAVHRVERAQMMLSYADGSTLSSIARSLHTNRPKVERCIDKALQLGALAALADAPRSGRPAQIPAEARVWVVSLACQKPKDLGHPEELWTTRLLAEHVHANCHAAGHSSLARLGRGTVSKILASQSLRPHKITYYLERRDKDFDQKMAQVLFIYNRWSNQQSDGAADQGNPASHQGGRRLSGRQLGGHAGRGSAPARGLDQMGHTALSGHETLAGNGFANFNRLNRISHHP